MGLPALDPSKRDLEIVEDGIKGPTLDHVRHLHLNPLQCFLLPSLASRSPRATLVASTPARPSVPSRRCAVTTRIERALGCAAHPAPRTRVSGKGIYLQDSAAIAAQHCHMSGETDTGLLLLCEVALGESKEETKPSCNR